MGEGWSSLIDEFQCLKVPKWLTFASVECVDTLWFVNDVSERLVSMVFSGWWWWLGGVGGWRAQSVRYRLRY